MQMQCRDAGLTNGFAASTGVMGTRDAKTVRPGNWLASVFCISFSALTLLVGWKERRLARKKSASLIPKDSVLEQAKEKTKGS